MTFTLLYAQDRRSITMRLFLCQFEDQVMINLSLQTRGTSPTRPAGYRDGNLDLQELARIPQVEVRPLLSKVRDWSSQGTEL
jgi:hypothetical protein